MHLPFLRNLFEYDLWANREALASLKTVAGDVSRAQRYFQHIVGAQRIWLSRFETPHSPVTDGWPNLTLDEARAAMEELHGRWMKLLDGMTPEKITSDLVYRNLKGQEFKTPVQDILMHLVMHSVYHRGQVASAVRDSGGKPAATDYTVYVRQVRK